MSTEIRIYSANPPVCQCEFEITGMATSTEIWPFPFTIEAVSHDPQSEACEVATQGADTCVCTGTVKDKNGTPLSGVAVFCNLGGWCLTNANGYYSMVAVAGESVICAILNETNKMLKYECRPSGETRTTNFQSQI